MTAAIPKVDRFVDWVEKEMPALTWTPEGVEMDAEVPVALVHPDFGPIAQFDMTAAEAAPEALGDFPVYVTTQKIYLQQRGSDLRVIDLMAPGTEAAQEMGSAAPTRITGELLKKIYRRAKPWVLLIVTLSFSVIFYLMQIVQGLVSSLAGLVANRFRSQKLSYAAILNASFYAMTLSWMLDTARLLVPALAFVIPGGFFVNVLLTALYLFMAIKLTDVKPASE
jgi:hypothetical protein